MSDKIEKNKNKKPRKRHKGESVPSFGSDLTPSDEEPEGQK